MSFLRSLFKSKQTNHHIKKLNPFEYKSLINKANVQLIDVRTPNEFKREKINGAKNIDYYSRSFIENLKSLDKEKPVFLYCKSGVRSRRAAKKLAQIGFVEIYDLKGGIMNWK